MAFLVSFVGFRPPPRYLPIVTPWTFIEIRESLRREDLPTAPVIDTVLLQNIGGLDQNPQAPAVRTVSSRNATLRAGWYRIDVFDADDVVAEGPAMSESAGGGALPPSPSVIRERSPFLSRTFLLTDADGMWRLGILVAEAISLVQELTGRVLDEALPERLVPLALRAVMMKTEAMSSASSLKRRKGQLQSVGLRSFSAGPYSESYFGPGEAMAAKALDPDTALHEVLWALATEEKRGYWLRVWGVSASEPFFQVQSFDYRQTARRGRFRGY